MNRFGKALVFIFLLILVTGVALDHWRTNRHKYGSIPLKAVESSFDPTVYTSTTSTTLPAAVETEKIKVDLKCETYHYSTCPEGCEPVCVSSVCSDGECTMDCDGPGSCRTKP